MSTGTVGILAVVELDGRRVPFDSLAAVRRFVAGLLEGYGRAVAGRKAAQLAERDAALRLGGVLVQLRGQIPREQWAELYRGLDVHRKRAQRCVRLAALADPAGRVSAPRVRAARAERLAAMSFDARRYWASHPLFTTPAEKLGHRELCSLAGVRPLPGLAVGEVDRRPVGEGERATSGEAARRPVGSGGGGMFAGLDGGPVGRAGGDTPPPPATRLAPAVKAAAPLGQARVVQLELAQEYAAAAAALREAGELLEQLRGGAGGDGVAEFTRELVAAVARLRGGLGGGAGNRQRAGAGGVVGTPPAV